ncbi:MULTISPECIES: antA/AntB antirepressor family protein [unclassified Halomonas]|uniref:antA/AntB antirepressor family protein n=1 Tax=unclassified Halomonas TaxID=2609666 RepID=UPI0004B16EC4|nr:MULTISPECIES: antA/AntB antirepressor family protein [unclassified Halomonas]PKH63504.1 hypothetical protein CXF94_01605 [Halomonas sp. Choline-3u-9]QGQ69796.1 hypothetical protein FDY98_06435 [Halomonas sp. PA16-9]
MNSHLIPVFQSESKQLLCNARDLHEFLEVGRDFSNWIRGRIEQYGFIEAEDYVTVQIFCSPNPASKVNSDFDPSNLENQTPTNFAPQNGGAKNRDPRGGHNRVDYHLTIGMAKELAMIENNAMGRRVRHYFIQRERQAIELLQQQANSVRPLEEVRAEIGDTPKFRYLLILQEQSRSCARQLDQAQGPHERYTLHCQLRQINNVIGIPTQPLVKQDEVGKLASAHKGSATSTHNLEN